jgi:hypothetical protein
VLLVVIGPRWLDAHPMVAAVSTTRTTAHRNPYRPAGQLACRPLCRWAAQPCPGQPAPRCVKPLVRRNAHEITDKRWDYDGRAGQGPAACLLQETVSPLQRFSSLDIARRALQRTSK